MNQIKAAIEEITGMFVDDWRFAACALGWVAVARFAFQSWAAAPYLLVAGLALVLLAFTRAEARKT